MRSNTVESVYPVHSLISTASQLLITLSLPQDRATVVAETLVEADLMGHSTHGLALLPGYLSELSENRMTKVGEPEVISDAGSALTWNGNYLPGPWLVREALDLAISRIIDFPVVTVVIQRSHHIACLAAYLERATQKGLVVLLASSDPSVRSVAPYGGIEPVYTPNPIAAGIPTKGDPIFLDISTSTTANGSIKQYQDRGKRFPGPWLLDNQGNGSNDPADFFAEPPGSVLPLGGLDLGYKGFALGLLVEALTAGLGGYGRSDHPERWSNSVFLQVIDPATFGGHENFLRETAWLTDACRSNPVKPGMPPVRLPGERAIQLRAEQLENGVVLDPAIFFPLESWANKLGVELPQSLPE